MIRSSITLFLMALVSCAFAQKKSRAPEHQVLFSVNNRPVTVEEFEYLYRKNYQDKEKPTAAKVQEYFDLFVNFKLKVEEARTRGTDTTAAFVKEYNSYKDELRRPYLPESRIVDSVIRLTYDRLREEVRASHILVLVKPDAAPADTLAAYNRLLDIRKRILAGEDFGTLAAQYSEDPSAKSNQGDLGYFTALQMVYPFESAAYHTPAGSVTNPVRTRFGYHLIKVIDRKPARGEVEVSHIMIRTNSDNDEAARNKIFEVYDQLRGGVAWEELCKQYSEDLSTKDAGGRLRPFGVGAMAAVPEFERAAFALQNKGDYTDPFKTAYGWHIVRLENKIPLPSFEELAPTLKQRVSRDERVQLSRQAAHDKLRRDLRFTEQDAVKKKVLASADSSLIKGKWQIPAWPDASKTILCTAGNARATAQDFFVFVKKNQHAAALTPAAFMEQLYTTFTDRLINEQFEQKIIRSNPDFSLLLTEYYEGILLFDIMEKEVWNKASQDSAGQVAYFQAHQQSYTAGERVAARIITANSREALDDARKMLEAGDENALRSAVESRKIREESDRFQRNDRPVLARIDWKPGIYTVENGGMYYLVKIIEVIPPGPMNFTEARSAVISDYQTYLEKNWIAELKKKYPVKINEKSKKYVMGKFTR